LGAVGERLGEEAKLARVEEEQSLCLDVSEDPGCAVSDRRPDLLDYNGQDNPGRATADEEIVWKLEQSYWEYVKALEVAGYKNLWHENFLGWPSTAPAAMGKDHIADWLEEDRGARNTLQCYKLEPAGFTPVGDGAVTHYRLTEHWLDKGGKATKGSRGRSRSLPRGSA